MKENKTFFTTNLLFTNDIESRVDFEKRTNNAFLRSTVCFSLGIKLATVTLQQDLLG